MENRSKTVNQVSRLTGVTVRALHYYDEIGLLSPSSTTDSGYRLYDDRDLRRLQTILLFRELEFPLKDIARMIDAPSFDRLKALDDQIKLLELKRDRLERLIDHANRLKIQGEAEMKFDAFDKKKIEAYTELARQTWGQTDAYKEYEEKSKGYDEIDQRRISEGLMEVFCEFGDLKTLYPSDPAVQAQVKKLQDYITEYYYKCTDQILACLGNMYTAGGEMTTNIEVAGGKGTAEFVNRAIEVYCGKEK